MQENKHKKPYIPVSIEKVTYAATDVLTESGEGFDDTGSKDNTGKDFTNGWDLG